MKDQDFIINLISNEKRTRLLPYLEAAMKPPITGSRTAKRFILVGDVEESWSRLLYASAYSSILFCLQRFLCKAFFLDYSKEINLRDCE